MTCIIDIKFSNRSHTVSHVVKHIGVLMMQWICWDVICGCSWLNDLVVFELGSLAHMSVELIEIVIETNPSTSMVKMCKCLDNLLDSQLMR